jgi:hypothetical protein
MMVELFPAFQYFGSSHGKPHHFIEVVELFDHNQVAFCSGIFEEK